MARGTFGERLKRERELREVTLEEVAKATRIAPKFLEALENEQWERLPGGVFGRGFVRSTARYLGLSEEDLLSEYDLARGEAGNSQQLRAEERLPSPPKWIPALAGVLVVGLLIGLAFGGRYLWQRYQAHRAGKRSSAITDRFEVTAANLSVLLLNLNGPTVPRAGFGGASYRIVLTAKNAR